MRKLWTRCLWKNGPLHWFLLDFSPFTLATCILVGKSTGARLVSVLVLNLLSLPFYTSVSLASPSVSPVRVPATAK
jgi:hypothetical protein